MKYYERFEQIIEKQALSGTEGEVAFLLKFLHNVAIDLNQVNEVTIQQKKRISKKYTIPLLFTKVKAMV